MLVVFPLIGMKEVAYCQILVVGLLWLKWAGLPLAVLGPCIRSKRVETGPTATQFGLVCAQTMPRLPGAHLRQAELF